MLALGNGVGIMGAEQALGPELIVNGGFDADTNWNKGTGWTIAAGVATCAAGSANLSQGTAIPIRVGSIYIVTFTVLGYTSGSINTSPGGIGATSLRNANGTYTERFKAQAAGSFYFTPTAFTGSVDNISLKEILNVY